MKLLKAGMATLAITATVIGCDPDFYELVDRFPVPTGELEVRTVTGGANIDPDGYEILLQEELGGGFVSVGLLDNDIGVNDVWMQSLTTGQKTMTLADVATNCSVDVNPQDVTVRKNRSVTITFNVTCS